MIISIMYRYFTIFLFSQNSVSSVIVPRDISTMNLVQQTIPFRISGRGFDLYDENILLFSNEYELQC